MRQRGREIPPKGGWHFPGKVPATFWGGGASGQRQVVAFAGDAAKNRVHEAGRAFLACLAREIDGIVDGRRRRNPIEMQNLKRGQTEDVEDFAIELLDG